MPSSSICLFLVPCELPCRVTKSAVVVVVERAEEQECENGGGNTESEGAVKEDTFFLPPLS